MRPDIDREALLSELWMSLAATITQIEDYLDDGVALKIEQRFQYGSDPKWYLKNGLQRRIAEIVAKAQLVRVETVSDKIDSLARKAWEPDDA